MAQRLPPLQPMLLYPGGDSVRILRSAFPIITIPLVCLGLSANTIAAPPEQDVRATIEKGVEYLRTTQNEDGSFAPRFAGPGITALTVVAMLRAGYTTDDPTLAKAMQYLEGSVQPDGGIYGRGLANYTTSLALVAFSLANKDGNYDPIIANAVKFLKGLQFGDDVGPDDPRFGGTGYGGRDRPDLSNTQFFIEALREAGVPEDDPAIQRALAFVSRSQNLTSEQNQLTYAAKTTDEDKGGFVYNPQDADDADSPRRTPAGGLRSEGAMTYVGLKSFLYAGVTQDDPRVKAAIDWIGRHYSLEENPGTGQAGYYYYVHTFAKALDAIGSPTLTDASGTEHDWRQELFAELASRQREDGSWSNENSAFLENQPELATAFAILALSYCLPQE